MSRKHVTRASSRANRLATVFAVAILAGGTPAIAAETSLRMSSEPGDYIGGGQEHFYSESAGTFIAQTPFAGGFSLSFQTPNFEHWWHLDFAAPDGATLAPGLYVGAARVPFQGPGQPGLSVGGDGRGCNQLTGAFEVKQIRFDAGGSIRSFWAVFEQHCEGEEPALTGDVRYAADVVVAVKTPVLRRAPRARLLTFQVTATEVNGNPVSLAADGLPTGATFVDHGDGTGTFGWTPPVDAPLGRVTVRFRGSNGLGQTDSATTSIDVRGVTRLDMKSAPGDYIGAGQTYRYDDTAAVFRIRPNFANGVSLSLNTRGASQWWHLDFAAPGGAPLEVGSYPIATRFPFQAPGEAGLDIGGNGRGCNMLTGSFEVKQMSRQRDGSIESFWATFEQHCEGGTAALLGELKYNADVEVEPGALALSGLSGDFDGDGRQDLATWNSADGAWSILESGTGTSRSVTWGAPGDVPVPGDYDGDGTTDLAVWRPSSGAWFIIASSAAAGRAIGWGAPGDVPVPGDYDGDGTTDLAVWRPAQGGVEGIWFIVRSSDGGGMAQGWGSSSLHDVPVPADYDGDGKTDLAVWRPAQGGVEGVWFILRSSDGGGEARLWGASSLHDVPVPADYDGDGKADLAVWRPVQGDQEGVWFILRSLDGGGVAQQFGASSLGDIPLPLDFAGVGRAQFGIFRASTGEFFVAPPLPGTGGPPPPPPPAGTPPTIANLSFTPSSAPFGTGEIVVVGSITFSDPDADLSLVRLVIVESGQTLDTPVTPPATSGTVFAEVRARAPSPGTFTVAVQAFDRAGHASNVLTGTFTVTP